MTFLKKAARWGYSVEQKCASIAENKNSQHKGTLYPPVITTRKLSP